MTCLLEMSDMLAKLNKSFSNRFLSYKKYLLNVIDITIVLKTYKTTIFVT